MGNLLTTGDFIDDSDSDEEFNPVGDPNPMGSMLNILYQFNVAKESPPDYVDKVFNGGAWFVDRTIHASGFYPEGAFIWVNVKACTSHASNGELLLLYPHEKYHSGSISFKNVISSTIETTPISTQLKLGRLHEMFVIDEGEHWTISLSDVESLWGEGGFYMDMVKSVPMSAELTERWYIFPRHGVAHKRSRWIDNSLPETNLWSPTFIGLPKEVIYLLALAHRFDPHCALSRLPMGVFRYLLCISDVPSKAVRRAYFFLILLPLLIFITPIHTYACYICSSSCQALGCPQLGQSCMHAWLDGGSHVALKRRGGRSGTSRGAGHGHQAVGLSSDRALGTH